MRPRVDVRTEVLVFIANKAKSEYDEMTGHMCFPADGPATRFDAPRDLQYNNTDDDAHLEKSHYGRAEWNKEQRLLNMCHTIMDGKRFDSKLSLEDIVSKNFPEIFTDYVEFGDDNVLDCAQDYSVIDLDGEYEEVENEEIEEDEPCNV